MRTFQDLVASRQRWIQEELIPWCRQAGRADLLRAEQEWGDIAGRVDPNATLWTWAWSRFEAITHEGLAGVNETHRIEVTCKDGTQASGYPDGRLSERGQLHLIADAAASEDSAADQAGPFSIDDIAAIRRC